MRIKNFSLVAIILTFILIVWGAVVHNTESSLACPDWPLCYNEFFPKMEGAVFVEHGHRLLASLVGFFSILLVFYSYRDRYKTAKHHLLFRLSLLSLFLVLIQGVLGGITVIYRLPTIVSTSHLGLSLIYFLLLISIHHRAVLLENSSLEKMKSPRITFSEFAKLNWKPLFRHGLQLAISLLFLQIMLGAFIRHAGAGAACGLGFSNSLQCLDYSNWKLTLWPSMSTAQLHMVHRLFAIVVSILLFVFLKEVKVRLVPFKNAQRWVTLSFLFIAFQVLIGVIAVAYNLTVIPTTLHLAGAALALGGFWKLNLNVEEVEDKYLGVNTHSFLSDIFQLTKPKLSLLVIATALVGSYIAPEKVYFFKAALAFFLISMVVTGAAALNCYIERDLDLKMLRTQSRPLPSKRMPPKTALIFGLSLLTLAIPSLFIFINALTGFLALAAAILYLYAYTPLKQKSELAVYVGAIPGALPPVMGWTAVMGKIDMMAIVLFVILFTWQLPHFLAISLYHASDYKAADIKVYPNLENGKNLSILGIFIFTLLLFFVSLLPAMYSLATREYTLVAIGLSSLFVLFASRGFWVMRNEIKQRQWARNYFYGSISYLPLLLGALIFLR